MQGRFETSRAWSGIVSIRSDGSIDPSTAPISTHDSVTYTLGEDIEGFVVIEKDNIVVDGSGHKIQGSGSGTGIDLTERHNVFIKNFEIRSFDCGIYLSYDLNVATSGGMHSSNTISSNNLTENNVAIKLSYDINVLSLSGSDYAVFGDNSIYGNSFRDNNLILETYSDLNVLDMQSTATLVFGHNRIFSNNIEGNDQISAATIDINVQNGFGSILSGVDFWDNGYPSGGNYWSNYIGVDVKSGSYQNETGSDGIGDTPYVIGASNTDHYPLMTPYSIPEFPSFLIMSVFMIMTLLAVIVYRRRKVRYEAKTSGTS